MSSTVCWSPLQELGHTFPTKLKYLIRKREGDNYGCVTLTEADVPYFQGAIDAGMGEAQIVIDAIREYNGIKVYEEF